MARSATPVANRPTVDLPVSSSVQAKEKIQVSPVSCRTSMRKLVFGGWTSAWTWYLSVDQHWS